MTRPGLLAILPLFLAAPVVHTAGACDGIDTELTATRKTHFAPILADLASQPAREVTVPDVLRQGDWTVVHGSFQNAEDGYFFHQTGTKLRYVDVWGGMVNPDDPDDAKEVVSRARGLGAPEALPQCFVWTVTSH